MQDLPAVRAPEFPRGLDWVNAPDPVTLAQFRGRFVAIEFWTSC